MENHWDRAEAGSQAGELQQLIYAARLLGREESLNLYGSGNASVKLVQPDLLGVDEQILYIDNGLQAPGALEPSGFTPVRRTYLARLAQLQSLPDDKLTN